MGGVIDFKMDIILSLESRGKRAKGKVGFRRHHLINDHLVTLRITVEECRNNKIDIFCCCLNFRKDFKIIPQDKLWKRLEETMVPPDLRVVVVGLYKNVISKINVK